MTTPTTSGCEPSFGLENIVRRTITNGSYDINNRIRKVLYGTCLKKINLQVSDPSYKLRYQYSVRFWKEETKSEMISEVQAQELVKKLKIELNKKSFLYPEESNENDEQLDKFYSDLRLPKPSDPDEKPVWYVTSKCENKFYVKSANRSEHVVNKTDFELFSYSMICPGDEFKIESDGDKKRVCIVK